MGDLGAQSYTYLLSREAVFYLMTLPSSITLKYASVVQLCQHCSRPASVKIDSTSHLNQVFKVETAQPSHNRECLIGPSSQYCSS
jgi:hypothetical protein